MADAAFLLRAFQADVHGFRLKGHIPDHSDSRLHTVSSAFGPWPIAFQPIATTMALTPARRHLAQQVSSLISLTLPNVPPPTTRVTRISLCTPSQRIRCVSGFAFSQPARRHSPPNRVRLPADRQFASGCSPPRLAATQLPSATGPWLTLTRTLTVLCARLHERTGSRALAAMRSLIGSRA